MQSTRQVDDDGIGHRKVPTIRILLLDDDKICRLTTEVLLKRCQHKVTSVKSVEEAFGALDQEKNFDLILSDCQMPGEPQDGLDFAKALNEDPERFFSTPLVMMSATSHSDEMRRKALSLGALHFFRKPLSLSDASSLARYVEETEAGLQKDACPEGIAQEFHREPSASGKRSRTDSEIDSIDQSISFLRRTKQMLARSLRQKKEELAAWDGWIAKTTRDEMSPEAVCSGLDVLCEDTGACEQIKSCLLERSFPSHGCPSSCSTTRLEDAPKQLSFWGEDSQRSRQLDLMMKTLKPAQLQRRHNASLIVSLKLVSSLSFSRDAKQQFCATGGSDKKLRVYSAEQVLMGSILPRQTITLMNKISSLSWCGNGRNVAAATHDGGVSILDIEEGLASAIWKASAMCNRDIDWACWDHIASGGDDGILRLWDANHGGGVPWWQSSCGAAVCSVRVCPTNHNLVACGSSDRHIRIWDTRTEGFPIVDFDGHDASISSIQWDPEGSALVSSATDSTVKKWRHILSRHSREQDCQVFRGHLARRNFTGLDVSSSGLIACGSETNEVVVYGSAMSRPWLRNHLIEQDPPDRGDGAALNEPTGYSSSKMVRQLTAARTFFNRDGLFVSCLAWRAGSIWAVSSSGRLQVFDVDRSDPARSQFGTRGLL